MKWDKWWNDIVDGGNFKNELFSDVVDHIWNIKIFKTHFKLSENHQWSVTNKSCLALRF